MANKIIPKRSSVAGKAPATTDLQTGEIAVNLTDRKIYTKDAGGNVVQLGGGSGDVIGPSSSTDNALVRFDGTTGKLVQNSLATLDDYGALSIPGLIITAPGGVEGGEIALAKPQSGTIFTTNIAVDVNGSQIRFFMGTTLGDRGCYLDYGAGANGLIWNNGQFTSGGGGDIVWIRFTNGFTIQTGVVNLGSTNGVDYGGSANFPRAFTQVVRPILGGINAGNTDTRLFGNADLSWTATGLSVGLRNHVNASGSSLYIGYIVMGWS